MESSVLNSEAFKTMDVSDIDLQELLEAPNTLIEVELSSDAKRARIVKESNKSTPPFGIWFKNLSSNELLEHTEADNFYQAFYTSTSRTLNYLKEQARTVRLYILQSGEPTFLDSQINLHRLTELQCELEMSERLLKDNCLKLPDVEYIQNFLVTLHSEISLIRKKAALS